LNRNHEEAYIFRAEAYHKLGREAQAMMDYRLIMRLNPNNALAFERRGFMYLENGKLNEALEDLNQAIRLNPTAESYYIRATIYASQNNTRVACQDLRQAAAMGHKEAKQKFDLYCPR